MLDPGRQYVSENASGYRYGFNGKENDNDIETGAQDYGMRIYDGRIGKFLSVDPITMKYPNLTPYQFASNSPISGIDLDGMEYLTAIYNVTIKNGIRKLTADYIWYDNQVHNNQGGYGQGVNYVITINNFDAKYSVRNNYFVSRGENSTTSSIFQYGNYMGSDPLPNFNIRTGNPVQNTYRYDIDAVDYVDQQAKMHDIGYDRVNAVGGSSLFSDWGTTPYDVAGKNAWENFYSNYAVGSTDPFNGLKVNKAERKAAWRAKTLFGMVINHKQAAISKFMQQNYTNEASWDLDTKKATESNYQLFLKKYMEKDNNGQWRRKEGMWEGNKEDGFTPKAQEQKQTEPSYPNS